MKYKLMYLFGEKEGIFKEVGFVLDSNDPDKLLLFDTEEEALSYSKGYKKWHVVPHDE
mgnify:FL=1|tara:strand:+ start:8 stop:181 length:174 start_codon:yes stop_codon:yes gene_type:complete